MKEALMNCSQLLSAEAVIKGKAELGAVRAENQP